MKIHPLFLSRKKDNNSASFSLHFIGHQTSAQLVSKDISEVITESYWGGGGCWGCRGKVRGNKEQNGDQGWPPNLLRVQRFPKWQLYLPRKLEDVTLQNLKPLCFSWKMNDTNSNNNNHGTLHFSKDMQIFCHLIFTTSLTHLQDKCCCVMSIDNETTT